MEKVKRLKLIGSRVVEVKAQCVCIAEVVFCDDLTKETVYCTATFDEGKRYDVALYRSSYIDFALNGGEKPVEIKWDTNLFADYTGETAFELQWQKIFNVVSEECMRLIIKKCGEKYLAEKSVKTEKPHRNIEYKIIDRKKIEEHFSSTHTTDTVWEIEFYLPNVDKTIFVMSTDSYGDYYACAESSMIEDAETMAKRFYNKKVFGEKNIPNEIKELTFSILEEYESFSETVGSEYYDLFYELEQFKDEDLKED